MIGYNLRVFTGAIIVFYIFLGIYGYKCGYESRKPTNNTEILSLISEVDEFEGAWRALGNIAPEQLSFLKHVATIESIGSSTPIEGSKLSDSGVEALLSNIQINKFGTRDEEEVAGYSAVMNIIFENYEHIPLTANYIKQLHNELLRHSAKDQWHKGNYNAIGQ